MGEVVPFRPKPLTGFIPELPEPFASNLAKTRKELAEVIPPDIDRSCSEINPDCA